MGELKELVRKHMITEHNQVVRGEFELGWVHLNQLVDAVQEKHKQRGIVLLCTLTILLTHY